MFQTTNQDKVERESLTLCFFKRSIRRKTGEHRGPRGLGPSQKYARNQQLGMGQAIVCPSIQRTCMVNTKMVLYSIWANYNISLTWIKAIWGMIPLINHDSSEVAVRSL